MFFAVVRSVFAVLLGLVTAFVLVVGVEWFGSVVHPFPPGADPTDLATCIAHVAAFPEWVLGVVVGLWGVTSLVGAWVATRVGTARHPMHGLFVGLILFAAAGFNMFMLPYPRWFEVANIVVLPTAAYVGSMVAAGWGRVGEAGRV